LLHATVGGTHDRRGSSIPNLAHLSSSSACRAEVLALRRAHRKSHFSVTTAHKIAIRMLCQESQPSAASVHETETMAAHFIVDGANLGLLFDASDEGRTMQSIVLRTGKDKPDVDLLPDVIEMATNVCPNSDGMGALQSHEFNFVFDGRHQKGQFSGQTFEEGKIKVEFSEIGRTADDVIIEILQQQRNEDEVKDARTAERRQKPMSMPEALRLVQRWISMSNAQSSLGKDDNTLASESCTSWLVLKRGPGLRGSAADKKKHEGFLKR